jgi:hypothetical protein
MHFWYDTRSDWDQKNLSKHGWLFPCYFCGQITSKYKTHKNFKFTSRILDLDLQTCKDCKDCRIDEIAEEFLTLYRDDKFSNR